MLELIKKEFHKSKQPIDLDLVTVDQVMVSDKFKYFIGYQEGEIVKPFCIILPQMSGYIKYFKNAGKNMSSMVRDDSVLNKYNEICDKIKEKLNIKFHSMSVYHQTYIKAKVREFDGAIKTNFLGDEIPKEKMHDACIAYITIDPVMKIVKKNYQQVYLEECKYKIKKIWISRFISAELESDSESESKPDTELMAKLESGSDLE